LITASTAAPAFSFGNSVATATASIKSFLLILPVLVSWEGGGPRLESDGVAAAVVPLQASGERETTPKDHARQAEIARFCAAFWVDPGPGAALAGLAQGAGKC
jgi:hypothetical protein